MSEVKKRLEEAIEKIPESLRKKAVPFGIVIAEEIVRELAEGITEILRERKTVYRTEKYEKLNFRVERVFDEVKVSGRGKLRELVLEVDSTSLRIELVVDGFNKLPSHRDLSELKEISGYYEYFDVIENNGKYIFRVGEIYFYNGFNLLIIPIQAINVQRLNILYDVEVVV